MYASESVNQPTETVNNSSRHKQLPVQAKDKIDR